CPFARAPPRRFDPRPTPCRLAVRRAVVPVRGYQASIVSCLANACYNLTLSYARLGPYARVIGRQRPFKRSAQERNMPVVKALRQADIFFELSSTQLGLVAAVCAEQSYRAGEIVFDEN